MTYYGSMIILIPAIIFTMYAQSKVNSNFRRYSNIRNARNMTGAEAARRMLDANGLTNVQIEQTRGSLTDHYDPRKRVLRLSQSVYGVNSIAAVSVACHEAGHAVEHAESYKPLKIRNSIVPLVNFASSLTWPLVIIGILLLANGSYMGDLLFNIGVITMLAVILFHTVTLPVEFNASHRAMIQLREGRMLSDEELKKTRKVLTAAALTYVAGAASALLQLLRLILIARSHSDDE